MSKYLKLTIYIVLLLIFLLGVLLAVSSRLNLPGNYKAYSVLTGSMEPNIATGSLIFVRPPKDVSEIKKGDVITFIEPGYENKFVTHRVVSIEDQKVTRLFKTRGDANAKDDPWLISYGSVQGVAEFRIPFVGYILNFLKTPIGIALFIILPALYLVILELKNIAVILLSIKLNQENSKFPVVSEEIKTRKAATTMKKSSSQKKKRASKFLAGILVFLVLFLNINPTFALFVSAPNNLSGNTITTYTWVVNGEVIINEVMWMGSSVSTSDEWIELRNMTDKDIDLTGWVIENAGTGSSSISLSGIIPAYGFYLLTNENSTNSAINDSISFDLTTTALNLANGGEQLTLKNNLGMTIDQTPFGTWPAGVNSADNQSMERNLIPGTGTLVASWHSCIDSGCNDLTYWDNESINYGTPKAANLSSNDPTSPDYVLMLEESMKTIEATVSATQSSNLNDQLFSEDHKESASSTDVSTPVPTTTPTVTPEPTILPSASPVPVTTSEPVSTPVPSPSDIPAENASSEIPTSDTQSSDIEATP